MLLVERYVEAVRSHLPRGERDDIAVELRDTLLSQIEAVEAGSGRRLTDDEVAAILRRYGAPHVVAARFGAPSYLIGPAIYPYYKAAVKGGLWVLGALLAAGVVAAAFIADDPAAAMERVVRTVVLLALGGLTMVTMVFARVERMTGRADWAERWDPRDLLRGTRRRTSIPRTETVVALALTAFWLLWWTDALPINHWLLWRRLPLAPAPIWDALTPLIVSLMVAHIVVSGVAIVRPRWVRFYEAAIVLLDIGIGVVLYRALLAPQYVVVTDGAAPGVALAGLLNTMATIGLLAFALLVLVSIGCTRAAVDCCREPAT